MTIWGSILEEVLSQSKTPKEKALADYEHQKKASVEGTAMRIRLKLMTNDKSLTSEYNAWLKTLTKAKIKKITGEKANIQSLSGEAENKLKDEFCRLKAEA